jgi:hypothetical protein
MELANAMDRWMDDIVPNRCTVFGLYCPAAVSSHPLRSDTDLKDRKRRSEEEGVEVNESRKISREIFGRCFKFIDKHAKQPI